MNAARYSAVIYEKALEDALLPVVSESIEVLCIDDESDYRHERVVDIQKVGRADMLR